MERDYKVANGKVRIIDVTEVELDNKGLEAQLNAIVREKLRLIEQNRLIIEKYNGLVVEEQNLKSLLAQLGGVGLEIINPEMGTVVRDGEENV